MIGLQAIGLVCAALALAPADPAARKESGMVVSRVNRMLVVMDTDQKTTRKYEVPEEATVSLDGKPAKIDDLQPGDMVDVSLGADQRVTAVEARSGKLKGNSASRAAGVRRQGAFQFIDRGDQRIEAVSNAL